MKRLIRVLTVFAICAAFVLCSVCAFAADAKTGLFGEINKGSLNSEGKVWCYKSPISETTGYDGSVAFIAKAENNTKTEWYIGKPDASEVILLEDAPGKFEGLEVYIHGHEQEVTIKHVPAELDGWLVQVKYEGEGGPVYSDTAKITVKDYQGDYYWNEYWKGYWTDSKSEGGLKKGEAPWWFVYPNY